ncbi:MULTISPECIES: hypothetical protein [unclassified Mesorhizobium]|uniref:hypothetical protein n=1 Tax=unclassified Mesorhizobium TaxID=325217 RepID=UPI0003CDE4EA|nr:MULTISPECIES: hypothetical protein [unclassified Mesorhizobium]ESX29475.1 hypothetical protein X765_14415 [Mesorhizobium sp. LSHC440B00]
MPRDEAYSRQKLERFLPVLYSAARDGVRAGLNDYRTTGHIHRKTTRRSIVRDHIVDNLRANLMLDPEVSIKDRNQTTYFNIGEFRLLAKMANQDGAVGLNRNQISLGFQENGALTLFASEELGETTNLYLSYVPNSITPDEPFVYVICPKADGYHWRMELEPPAAAADAEIGRGPAPDDYGDDLIRVIPDAKPDTSET